MLRAFFFAALVFATDPARASLPARHWIPAAELCPRAGDTEAAWKRARLGNLGAWLADNGAVAVSSGIARRDLIPFALEYSKFPAALRQFLVSRGAPVRLIRGRGVSDDPTWPTWLNTPDGRAWTEVPGSGGNPTRIVVNRLYDGHGSVNLVLHERAHTLDQLLGYPSSQARWRELMSSSATLQFIGADCGEYCSNQPREAFAELFAIYYSCPARQAAMRGQLPSVAAYFRSLESSATGN